jgi:hypothetical protein
MSVSVLVPCSFYCYGSVVEFEVGYCNTTSIALFAEYCLGYSQSSVFPNNFRVDFSISVTNVIGILIGIALNM